MAEDADDVKDSAISRSAVARALCAWDGPLGACPEEYAFRDRSDPSAVDVAFMNRLPTELDLYHEDASGDRFHRASLPAGARWDEDSFRGHKYVIQVAGKDVAAIAMPAEPFVAYAVEGPFEGIHYQLRRVDASRLQRPGVMRHKDDQGVKFPDDSEL